MNSINWAKIEKGIEKYSFIMALYKDSNDITVDSLFQKKFKGFYRMGRKPEIFYLEYFRLLEKMRKGKILTIEEILKKLFECEERKELSFASKMIATIDPNLPVWDSKVRDVLNTKYKTNFKKTYKEISEYIEAYNEFCNWYKIFLKTPDAQVIIDEFDLNFPNSRVSKVKKIDFIFWQTSIK